MGFVRWLAEAAGWFARRRELERLIDEEAIALVEERDQEEAYQTARTLERTKRAEGDVRMGRYFAKVAVRVADLTGRQIGPIDAYGGQSRYGPPRRRIANGRTERMRS